MRGTAPPQGAAGPLVNGFVAFASSPGRAYPSTEPMTRFEGLARAHARLGGMSAGIWESQGARSEYPILPLLLVVDRRREPFVSSQAPGHGLRWRRLRANTRAKRNRSSRPDTEQKIPRPRNCTSTPRASDSNSAAQQSPDFDTRWRSAWRRAPAIASPRTTACARGSSSPARSCSPTISPPRSPRPRTREGHRRPRGAAIPLPATPLS